MDLNKSKQQFNGRNSRRNQPEQRKGYIAGVESARERSFNLSIQKLVEKVKIHTTNVQESSEKIKDLIAKALMDAVRDTKLVAG